MPTVDLTRIAGNIGALNALNSLNYINTQLVLHQTRLATGKRINEAAEDPAGMSLAITFDVRREGLKTALKAIGDAKNLMSTMEGGLQKIQNILVKMRNKALEAQGATIGQSEKEAIRAQLESYRDEINDIVSQTQWNGNPLLGVASASGSTAALDFLTSDDVSSGSTTTQFRFTALTTAGSAGGSGILGNNQNFWAGDATSGSVASASGGLGLGASNLDVTASGSANQVVLNIDNAIKVLKTGISQVGAFTARLGFKEEMLTVQYTNTEAAYNRIMNADMAAEQVEASKYMILQQTATAMLAQANSAPQFILSLFQ